VLTERVDAIERKLAALQAHEVALSEAIVCAFGYAGIPAPPGLTDEYRPVLSLIQGGRR
jgi:hypothetical protein